MPPAIVSASSPAPQKLSKRLAPLIASPARFTSLSLARASEQMVESFTAAATARIAPRVEPKAVTVAGPAVQTGQTGRFVFVLSPDNTAQRREVTLVRVAGDRAVVAGELQAGERVIVDGAQRVTEGTRAVERGAPQRVSSAQ